ENPKCIFDFLVERVVLEFEPKAPLQVGGDSRGERSRIEVGISPTPVELVDFYAPPRAEADFE
ncbi:MAG TPA: hypothetical protein VLJ38_18185, partial [Polyangiaceae bacterium]|nr:hypothetical protein [Polyangiaceae bacterium]